MVTINKLQLHIKCIGVKIDSLFLFEIIKETWF